VPLLGEPVVAPKPQFLRVGIESKGTKISATALVDRFKTLSWAADLGSGRSETRPYEAYHVV